MKRSSLLTASQARRQREVLLMATGIVILAFLFVVRTDQRVALRGLPNWPLPPLCGSRALFGVDCPGCGLTRSLIYLAHGQWQASFAAHRLGWLMAAAVLIQGPYRLLVYWRQDPFPFGKRVPSWFGWALIVLLIGNWALGQRI